MAGDTWRYQWKTLYASSSSVRMWGPTELAATEAYCIAACKACESGVTIAKHENSADDSLRADLTTARRAFGELGWVKQGKPYYKITAPCYDALLRTSLDHCMLDDVRLPFCAITLRYPDGRWERSPVSLLYTTETGRKRILHYLGQTQKELDNLGDGFGVPSSMVYEWPDVGSLVTVGSAKDNEIVHCADGEGMALAEMDKHVHVAIGVALLATHAHDELFSPVLLRRDEERWEHAPEDQRTRMVDRAQRLHKAKGWIVGHDLRCPTVRQTTGKNGEPTGRHLHFQHWRAGHFHRVRHGEGHTLSKLQWFRPTLIRPDLPCAPNRQRRYRVDIPVPQAALVGAAN